MDAIYDRRHFGALSGDVTLGHMRGWGHGADSATPLVDPFGFR
jgi:hypothetical protein